MRRHPDRSPHKPMKHEEIEEHLFQINEQITELYQQARYQHAIDTADQALDLARQHPDHPLGLAALLNDMALSHEALGNYLAAQPLLEEAVALHRPCWAHDIPT